MNPERAWQRVYHPCPWLEDAAFWTVFWGKKPVP